ncbi:hypothetical protein RRG08_017017 [Elysia crispata]|uniref:Uncharacterized protein n=1 Tax=Elysia crispata TaxID=231223 RepID=A0AAE1CPK8_9GAST|nr:hypothetical protein RRG08_017017 [Elysia crispata]
MEGAAEEEMQSLKTTEAKGGARPKHFPLPVPCSCKDTRSSSESEAEDDDMRVEEECSLDVYTFRRNKRSCSRSFSSNIAAYAGCSRDTTITNISKEEAELYRTPACRKLSLVSKQDREQNASPEIKQHINQINRLSWEKEKKYDKLGQSCVFTLLS